MKALTLTMILACSALALAGCRKTHLGPDTGQAYRNALDAQAESNAKSPKTSARDALRTVDVHYNGPQGAGSAQLSDPMAPSNSYVGYGGGSATPSTSGGGASSDNGGIRLRAK